MAAAADRPPRKPISNSAKGAYYKGRSKKWLEAQGFTVWDMEQRHNIYSMKSGKPVLIHSIIKDQLGADLGAMKGPQRIGPHQRTMGEFLFVQVKGGETARSGLSAARRAFRQHDFPLFAKRHIHVWIPRKRGGPEIIDCSEEEYDPCEEKSKRSPRAKTSAF